MGPCHEKTKFVCFAYAKRKAQISCAVTAQLISAFVFATRIVQFLFYLNPKFQASSSFLCLYRLVCVKPVRKPHCWFFHEAAQISIKFISRFRYCIMSNDIWGRVMRKSSFFAYAKRKAQIRVAKTKALISCAVTAQLISAFVFATRIVQILFFLNPKFQGSSNLL